MLSAYIKNRFTSDPATPAVRARCRRVAILVVVVLVLSIFDLVTTISLLRSMGMQELNPVAAYVISGRSITGLILFKIGSVLGSVSLILLLRHLWQGEIAAWTATAIVGGLAIYWSAYTTQLNKLQDSDYFREVSSNPAWTSWSQAPLNFPKTPAKGVARGLMAYPLAPTTEGPDDTIRDPQGFGGPEGLDAGKQKR